MGRASHGRKGHTPVVEAATARREESQTGSSQRARRGCARYRGWPPRRLSRWPPCSTRWPMQLCLREKHAEGQRSRLLASHRGNCNSHLSHPDAVTPNPLRSSARCIASAQHDQRGGHSSRAWLPQLLRDDGEGGSVDESEWRTGHARLHRRGRRRQHRMKREAMSDVAKTLARESPAATCAASVVRGEGRGESRRRLPKQSSSPMKP